MNSDVDHLSGDPGDAVVLSTYESDVTPSAVQSRAAASVLIVFSWNLASLVVAFAGNVVLARLLTPHDFGIVAIGGVVMLIASAISEGGIAGGLLRRPRSPSDAELRTVTGLQLVLTGFAAALVTAGALRFGTTGAIVAFMAWSMPVSSLQAPSRILFARNLEFRAITMIDACGTIANYAFAIGAVLAGFGVWGLASGWVVRAVAGTLVVPFLPRGRLYRPTLERLREFREIITFGIRFQANWITTVLSDQVLNMVVVLLAGVSTLGLWALAVRLLQLPTALMNAVGRVTFPTLSHVLGEQRDLTPLIGRMIRLTAVGSVILLSPFLASSPGLVPALFGEKWVDVVWVLPGACLGILIGGSIAAVAIAFLFASNKPGSALPSVIVFGVVEVAVSAILLPFVGIGALGIGLLVAALVEAAVLRATVSRLTGVHISGRSLAGPVLALVVGATPGWVLAEARSDLLGGVLGGTLAAVLTLATLAGVARPELNRLVGGTAEIVRRQLNRHAPAPSD